MHHLETPERGLSERVLNQLINNLEHDNIHFYF